MIPMNSLRCAILTGALLAMATAAAADDNATFFVRPAATAAAMFSDRAQCVREAASMGSTASAYSNPEYGALSAMGSALNEDALHEGGIHKRMQHAILIDCMKRLGWTQLDPAPDEARPVAKASLRHPEALDAWLKAHEPPPAAPAVGPAAKP